MLRQLRELGVRIAIDDFGTGYSSLGVLKHMPIDTLKIDRLFIRNAPDDGDAQAIAKAMIVMAHGLGLHVVAEGVETPAQCRFPAGAGMRRSRRATCIPRPARRRGAGLDGAHATQQRRTAGAHQHDGVKHQVRYRNGIIWGIPTSTPPDP